MNNFDLTELEEKIKSGMDERRFKHTIGVMYTGASLAMKYGAPISETMVAGLLHDCAKLTEDKELLDFCLDKGIEVSDCERENAFLLHGKVGAYIARADYGIEDEDILNSVTWHTTGRPDMSLMEKIIFVADYIEPGRYKQKNLEAIRALAFTDLEETVYKIAKDTVEYLNECNKPIDDMTIKTRDFYERK